MSDTLGKEEKQQCLLSLLMPRGVVLLKQNSAAGRGWAKKCPVALSNLSYSVGWLGLARRFCSVVSSSCSQGTNFKLCFLQYTFCVQVVYFSVCICSMEVLYLFCCSVVLVVSHDLDNLDYASEKYVWIHKQLLQSVILVL